MKPPAAVDRAEAQGLFDRARAARQVLNPGGLFWRRLAYAGARYGPAPWVRYSPALFGLAFAAALPEKRATIRDNLRRALGPRDPIAEQLAVLRTFRNYAYCLSEALGAERAEGRSGARCSGVDAEAARLLSRPGGLVVLTAHAGAWDAGARLLARDHQREVVVVMAKEDDPGARVLHDGVRHRAGVRVVHVGGHPTDALPLLEHLRRGAIVAIQLDRLPPGARAVSVELFGGGHQVPEGPFTLAALAGVPLLPLFVQRRGFFDYALEVGPLIELPRRPDAEVLRGAAQLATTAMERFIRHHPTQWFHFGTGR